MLLLGSSFAKIPVLSLRTGAPVGRIIGHLINPHSLKVDALWCRVGSFPQPHLLLIQDIREASIKGVIVDDRDSLVLPEDVVKLKNIIDLQFELITKKVLSGRHNLGRVSDYAVDQSNFVIQKIYVTPSIWNRMKATALTIDRSQVLEVSHAYIKVKEARVADKTPKLVKRAPIYSPAASSAAVISE